jgi:hypothetical protein
MKIMSCYIFLYSNPTRECKLTSFETNYYFILAKKYYFLK